jgi:very-short-patch-repair endonuclease
MKTDFPRLDISPVIKRKMIEVARVFRKTPTRSEAILWEALRGKKLNGIKFRRQQPIGYFVVDFYNSNYHLVVEVDGPIHENQKESDASRQQILEELGLNVLRIKAEVVEKNLPMALDLIRNQIEKLQQTPSPFMGEGWGEG